MQGGPLIVVATARSCGCRTAPLPFHGVLGIAKLRVKICRVAELWHQSRLVSSFDTISLESASLNNRNQMC